MDALAEEAPLLSALSAASIQGQLATGPRAGRRMRCMLSDPIEGLPSGQLGFSVRAGWEGAMRKKRTGGGNLLLLGVHLVTISPNLVTSSDSFGLTEAHWNFTSICKENNYTEVTGNNGNGRKYVGGLQIRSGVTRVVLGGFNSHTFPPNYKYL